MYVVARDLEHVAPLVENSESPRRRDILEGETTVERIGPDADAGWPADLYRLRLLCPAGCQHRPHADAEGKLVDTRAGAIAGDRKQLRTGRMRCPAVGIPGAALHGNQGYRGKGFHVIDHGRLVEIAVRHREGRAVTRRPALAFKRLDEGRLLAADIGAGPQVNFDVEIHPRHAQDIRPQQPGLTPLGQHRLEPGQKKTVLAAQIDKPATGT